MVGRSLRRTREPNDLNDDRLMVRKGDLAISADIGTMFGVWFCLEPSVRALSFQRLAMFIPRYL
jgi:hypothetical protein